MHVVLLVLGCTGAGKPGTPETPSGATPEPVPKGVGPVQTDPPNTPDQEPAFAGQTRAPQPATPTAWTQQDVARGLDHPWGLEVLPDGRMLVTERPGRMRIVTSDGQLGEPITGLPEVDARNQGGLLDVALAPDFATTRRIFWSFSEPRGEGKNGTAVASGVLAEDGRSVSDVKVVFHQEPAWDSTMHYGSRLVFTPDGHLFVTMGERSDPEPRQHAQMLSDHLGKIARIRPDGSVPQDNPFVGRSDARPEIWSYGHRNLQSATLDAQGRLWTVEHGPQGGDELNRPEGGKNYGWPIITYGEDYGGAPMGQGLTAQEGMEQPVYYWDPVIAPSGMERYTGTLFSGWQDDFLVGGLAAKALVRLSMEGDRVAEEEWLEIGARVRDVRQAPDGSILLLTDEDNGRIVRVTPSS
jgi:glucose/arabinose dehydrogenase